MAEPAVKRSPYHREILGVTVDVYRILHAFEVTDPCIQHAIKKLICAGRRLGGKTLEQDIAEAIWTLNRWQQMRKEEAAPPPGTER